MAPAFNQNRSNFPGTAIPPPVIFFDSPDVPMALQNANHMVLTYRRVCMYVLESILYLPTKDGRLSLAYPQFFLIR
jgi:hypothetical protein